LFAVRVGLQRFGIEHNFECKSIIEYYAQWIREGKLKVNSDWNKDLQIKFTVHDPCNLVRKGFGDPIAEDLRYTIKAVVGEENFIDMSPGGKNNYCCGGGGGALQGGLPDERREYGKTKVQQIQETKATYCITVCHNCHSQMMDLNEHFDAGYHSVHLWTLIGLSLGILSEDEREYLGPELQDVNLLETREV